MSINKFNATFDALCQPAGISSKEVDLNNIRRQTIRYLDSLGHCEFDFDSDRRQVFACPPVLVALPPYGLPKAVLTGARTPSMVRKIKDFVKGNHNSVSHSSTLQRSEHPLLPSAIYIEAVDHEYLQKVAQAAQIGCHLTAPAAWSLVNFSAGIENVGYKLVYEDRADINWLKRTFSTDALTFSKSHNTENVQGLVEYTNPQSQQKRHWIWDGNQSAEVGRDWGRYMILADKGVDVLLYDERRHQLAVPSTVPLPHFLARAAALCTGLAPATLHMGEQSIGGMPAGRPVDIYCAVPPPVATMISEKLSQNLIYHSTVPDSSGVIL
jgi:hypothetical protein